MTIPLPIRLELKRPMEPPASPYAQCGRCHYVGTDLLETGVCAACERESRMWQDWPEPELIELWYDQVAMWNEERVELAHVVAAMYFEASVFRLIYWGTAWLDPELGWVGARITEVRNKKERIWNYLNRIRSHEATNRALRRLFNADGREMLTSVLGEEDAQFFWNNYLQLADYRNQIVHRGRRAVYRAVEEGQRIVVEKTAGELLDWCLRFIPTCWVVFRGIWNEYVHKPLLTRNAL